jgi:uncharacterized protein (TIGR02996 family)
MYEDAFLETILDSPYDDAPRLIFADWLEDHGQEARAELIRIQCRLASDLSREERIALQEREAELLRDHGRAWLGKLADAVDSFSFHRGTACVRLQTGRFIRQKFTTLAQAWFVRAGVTEVVLHGATSNRKALFHSPTLARVHRLLIDDSQMDDDALIEAGAAPLRRLTSLAIHKCGHSRGMSVKGMQALIDSPHLRQLQEIGFRLFPLQPETIRLFTEKIHWPALRSIDIDFTRLHEQGLRRLLAAPWLGNLTRLGLYYTLEGDMHVREFLASPHLGRLRWLDLGGNALRDPAVEAVAKCPLLANLRWLSLRFAEITPRVAKLLAESPWLKNLEFLDLYSMVESNPCVPILRSRFGSALHIEYTPPV